MEPNPDQIAARRQLGSELRQLREDAYRSGQDLASALGWSQSKVSRIEQARTLPSVNDVHAVLRELRVPAAEQERLLTLAGEAAGEPGAWRNSTGAGLTRRQQDFVALERAASAISHYQPILIPGYLQTEAYARRVLEMAGSTSVDRGVELRLARRATLTAPNAPSYRILLLETALRWRPGPPPLMAEQLALVSELAKRPNVELRILRLDQEQVMYLQHPCMIFEFTGPAAHGEALVETEVQDVRITDAEGVGLLNRRFERLSSSAIAPSDSLAFIDSVADSYVSDRN
ncbi:helix-turn-helix transcriptional regulator [Rugosimonospora acidiphila]|uniref:Helix-turn-helix transcriptional regulator n=1 Tax=Rugosimonospora acidiphila TaxID=556531 RepID=A0ABP9RH80_9ACTN